MMDGGPRCLARETKFFKVLVEGFTEKLSIPKAFIEKMPEGLSGTVILHSPSGNCWPVRLSRTSKGTYLAGGWEAFVKHHSLIEGEFLVFSTARSMHFDVKIYGRNACERGDALTVEASPGPSSLKERKKCQSPRRDAGNMASTSKPKVLQANEEAHRFTNSLVRPNFVSQIKHYYLHKQKYLAVPAFFVRKHLPKTQMMKLQSPDRREWTVKFSHGLPRNPNRIRWIEAASANHIKEGVWRCIGSIFSIFGLQLYFNFLSAAASVHLIYAGVSKLVRFEDKKVSLYNVMNMIKSFTYQSGKLIKSPMKQSRVQT